MERQLEYLRTDIKIIREYVEKADFEAADQWLRLLDSKLDTLIHQVRERE